MSHAGDRYGNALAGRFFATPKTALVDQTAWPTRQAICQRIKVVSQRQRLHSARGATTAAARAPRRTPLPTAA